MRIRGIDFTSSPGPRKAISCVHAVLTGEDLTVVRLERWQDFSAFELALMQPGPWISGMDFPFGQASRFIQNIGWPREWRSYVQHVSTMSRAEFRAHLDAYRTSRPPGDKEHRRQADVAAASISPQKLYGVPVGFMFFEGAPRLLSSGVTIPGLSDGDPQRISVEAYPGALARHLIGRRSYKNDSATKQTSDQFQARLAILEKLTSGAVLQTHGVRVHADRTIAEDPGADDLDALLCAVQAASAWLRRDTGYGAPAHLDPNEGWIAEPTAVGTMSSPAKGPADVDRVGRIKLDSA